LLVIEEYLIVVKKKLELSGCDTNLRQQGTYRFRLAGDANTASILSYFKESLMDTVFTIVCLASQAVCLGLVIYVIRGWRKRMQNSSAKMSHCSEQVKT